MRTYLLAGVLGFALAFAAGGCGDGGNGDDFSNCGNGVLDSGEQCDDGNLADTDTCLSTCQTNVCGDGFADRTHDECETGIEPTCESLGFTSGTVVCAASCVADTSGCRNGGSPTPIPTATPVESGGATPTSALPTETPTPQPTPVGSLCSGTEQIVVTVALDADVDSATLNLAYGASVNLPGSGTDPAVKSRVAFTGSGLTAVNDFDADDDLIDDTVTITLVGDAVPAGPFATVTFDCVGGQPVPTADDLTCTASASLGPDTINPACAVSIQ